MCLTAIWRTLRLVRTSEGLQLHSYRCPCVVLCQLPNMAPHTSKPGTSVRSLCLILPHIVHFASAPCLYAPSSSTDCRFSKGSTLGSPRSSCKYTLSHAASYSTRVAHCPSSVGLVLGVSSPIRMDVHIFDFSQTDKRPPHRPPPPRSAVPHHQRTYDSDSRFVILKLSSFFLNCY